MKWSEHRRVTAEICKRFGLENCLEVTRASILPDVEPDYYWVYGKRRAYRRRVPHHDAMAVNYAFNYLKRARKAFLRGESYAEPLGRALHYLQDYSIDPTEKIWIFSYRSDSAHDERERIRVDVDESAINEAKSLTCYPHQFKSVVFQTKRGKNPGEISYACSFLTALALKMIVNPDMPENLTENYNKALAIHAVILLLPWLILLAFASGATYFVLSAIASLLLHYADFYYRRWKTDYEWFS
ncbi:hypothetical protein Ferp_1492 [Ferroglobus placidus DSM 10642]|uniref:Phospholipase C/D domain-containing protein n=1 Tax=Ferroglobus placidus (strain DSM 10642 / AEDII12DO) TaxID=589924 RepID=D3RYT0_FERPA|nr:hypothetical protein [Ferroglobus placidus]ADC65643.1 hypothetical protein Ferp_1492 [Ferroglobus placidus DSM 10642]